MFHRLRRSHLLARFVLVWFALSIGVAVASPLVNPNSTQLVCTGSGVMKVLVNGDDGVVEVTTTTMDCPLCASMSAPPASAQVRAMPAHPLSYVLQTIPAARIAALTGAPLPARGPPTLL